MPPSRPQCRGRCGTRATALAPPRSAAHSNLFCQRTFCHTYHKLSFSVPDGHFLIPHSDHDQKKYIICLIVTWCWSLPACLPPAPVSFSRTTWKHAKIFCLAFKNICVFYRHLSVHVRSCRRTNCWMLCYATPPDVWQLSEGGELSLSLRSYLKWQNQN